jgi:hypothetical protein
MGFTSTTVTGVPSSRRRPTRWPPIKSPAPATKVDLRRFASLVSSICNDSAISSARVEYIHVHSSGTVRWQPAYGKARDQEGRPPAGRGTRSVCPALRLLSGNPTFACCRSGVLLSADLGPAAVTGTPQCAPRLTAWERGLPFKNGTWSGKFEGGVSHASDVALRSLPAHISVRNSFRFSQPLR